MGVCFNPVNPETLVNGLSVLTSTFFGGEVVLIGVKLATLTLVGIFAAFNVLRAAGFTAVVLGLLSVFNAAGFTAATLVVGLVVLKAPVKLALVLLTLVTGFVKDVALFNKPVAVDNALKPVPTVDVKSVNVSLPVVLAIKFKPPTVVSVPVPVVNVDTLFTVLEPVLARIVEPANNTAFIRVASLTFPFVTNCVTTGVNTLVNNFASAPVSPISPLKAPKPVPTVELSS